MVKYLLSLTILLTLGTGAALAEPSRTLVIKPNSQAREVPLMLLCDMNESFEDGSAKVEFTGSGVALARRQGSYITRSSGNYVLVRAEARNIDDSSLVKISWGSQT